MKLDRPRLRRVPFERGAHLFIHQDGITRGSYAALRYELNAVQREFSSRKAIRRCGRNSHDCGSAFCEVCSVARASQLRRDLMARLSPVRFGTVLVWTATVASTPSAALGPLRADLVRVIQATTAGGWLKRRGVIGTARVIEPKLSLSGWHPHAHTMLVFRTKLASEEIEKFVADLIDRSLDKAVALGITTSYKGQDARSFIPSEAVDYLTKEAVRPGGQDAGSVLWHRISRGDSDALDLVHELEAGMFRARAIVTTGVLAPPLDFDDLIARGRI